MKIDFDNNVAIYIQIVELIKKYIISGYFKSGDRLPSIRDLALQFKVNPNTMQKALGELEELKLIYTERTNGKFVTNDLNLINKLKNEYALDLTSKYILNMNNLGFAKNEIIKHIESNGGIK